MSHLGCQEKLLDGSVIQGTRSDENKFSILFTKIKISKLGSQSLEEDKRIAKSKLH